jgi:hypothetical protein
VGADSEAEVRRALEPLARQGWRVAHGVDWPGRGDLDHVLRSPSGMGFVIDTKTLRYSRAQVARTVEAARWLARKRRRYPRGVLPVVCVTRARRMERFEDEALVVSLDRLMTALHQTRPLRQRSWSTRRSHGARRLRTSQRRVDNRSRRALSIPHDWSERAVTRLGLK